MRREDMKTDNGTGTQEHDIESLARLLLPEIQRFFGSEDGKQAFEKWKAEQVQTGKENE